MFAADCPTKRAAFMTDMIPGRWSHVPATFFRNGKRLNPRTSKSIYLFRHGCHNLYFRRQYFGFFGLFRRLCRRCIWIISSKPRRRCIFDDDHGHGNHSGELLLFAGCIVNFFVSYLICMFQDSAPAGSHNDPFLSSVCLCVCACASVCVCVYIYIYNYF